MSEYKPVDLGDVLARSNRLRHFDGATFYDIAESGEEDEVAGLAQELAGQDVPALVAEVRRLRREVAMEHLRRGFQARHGPLATMERDRCWGFSSLSERACPTCQAAASDNWNPSLPLDWTPEVKP